MTAPRTRTRIGRTVPTVGGRPDPPTHVWDGTGRTWEVGARLGEGGQGVVYRVQDPRFAVKLLNVNGSDREHRKLADRLARLNWLPLDDLPLARPIDTLRPPDTGYVMNLLDRMEPISELSYPPYPDDDDEQLFRWYRETGGLRRRLRVLARCAEVLAALHGRGIVYRDVSPNNVLVSAVPQRDEVWLIDTDNLAFESDPFDPAYTPYFAAPEVERGGNTPFTDVFSFAVLVHHTLVGEHPMIGDLVADGPVEAESDALRGLLPWTGHRTDTRNRSSFGMPRDVVLHPELHVMLADTFEDGMADPLVRPDLATWTTALYAVADRVVDCPGCGAGYHANTARCPWCLQPRPPLVLASVLTHVSAGELPPSGDDTLVATRERIVVQAHRKVLITARSARLVADDPGERMVELHWDGTDQLRIRNVSSRDLMMVAFEGGGRALPAGLETTTRVDKPGVAWLLHFGAEKIHSVLAFDPVG